MVEVSVITLNLEVKRPVVEIMKALTDYLHAMKQFHEIIVYIIKMTFDYLLVRSNKYAKIHFLKVPFDDKSAADGNIHGESDLVISMAFRNCMRTFHLMNTHISAPLTRHKNAQQKAGHAIIKTQIDV
ncbi:hypothetical protein BCU30_014545 [Vibrio lentus]|uniref:hypothetical protein n=1 Tax=Vibrio lentus TaxID=136468 RepID=UPI000C83F577|nr:hypothetical protein [Vibrio lentus]PMG20839.1 hypothetical protein BCU96_22305 [Vibrio lentus]PMH13946.1 hypothetical protein BCU76_01600 [Vibrio lentus]PMJ08409.1 hypothetical protein BCU30_08030 [Vibrio lentus]PMK86015.1 hypothetical protein BCT89_08020 [Vibrio lentus]PMN13216.1 hypothetical protein BCT39_23765 [Vibrio lentus]